LVMIVIISSTTIPLLKETAMILLQTTPKFMNIRMMKEKLLKFDGVLSVHEFHIWRLAGQKIIATIHVRFRSVHDYLMAADKIKSFFHDEQIHSTTIQPEFMEMTDDLTATSADAALCYLNCPPQSKCDESAMCCAPIRDNKTLAQSDSPSGNRQRDKETASVIPEQLSSTPTDKVERNKI